MSKLPPYGANEVVQEYYAYIAKLMGPNPDYKTLIKYADKLIKAAEVVNSWRTKDADIKSCVKTIRESIFLLQDRGELGSSFIIMGEKIEDSVAEHFIKTLRDIFGDSEGDYKLRWNDFCHTGRTSLILESQALRECACVLLRQATEAPPTNNFVQL